jgi:hypothetical protein
MAMAKLLSADPGCIGRPNGPAMPDPIPDRMSGARPRKLRDDLERLLGPDRVLHGDALIAQLVRALLDVWRELELPLSRDTWSPIQEHAA